MQFRRLYDSSTISPVHRIHPYTAKLIPQIARYLIERYTSEDDIVLDPFCGSGTSLLEARLRFRRAIGIDINPIAVLISKVKTSHLNLIELEKAIALVKSAVKKTNSAPIPESQNLEYWFSKKTLRELAWIKNTIESLSEDVSETTYNFLLLCFSAIIRKSSYADPYVSLCKSRLAREKIKNGWKATPVRYFETMLEENFKKIVQLHEFVNGNGKDVKIHLGDSRDILKRFSLRRSEKADLIVTSPPYINAHDYLRNHRLELAWLELSTSQEMSDFRRRTIGTATVRKSECQNLPETADDSLNTIMRRIWRVDRERSHLVYNYFVQMDDFFRQSFSILKSHGKLCIVSGDNTVSGIRVPTYKLLANSAEIRGFHLSKVFKDDIPHSTLAPGRSNHNGLIRKEWVLVLEK
jgi:DNA modification methylase